MKTLLLKQPGKVGDILICLPIAKWYSDRYEVHWLCPESYHLHFRNIDYCTPVTKPEGSYDKEIDLSFGIYADSPVHKWWIQNRNSFKSFVFAKYKIAQVPIIRRWKLQWKRDKDREMALYERIVAKYGKSYNLVHEQSGKRFSLFISVDRKAIFEPIEDFNIFDWYRVILCALEIHCIDSSLCNFVEVLFETKGLPKFYYDKPDDPRWNKTFLINDWRTV